MLLLAAGCLAGTAVPVLAQAGKARIKAKDLKKH
jgi:hypothetical protein